MFEDAIGRTKKLLCTQFQHWDIFYEFLVNSFQDTPGLLLVRTERFRVMNGYNGYLISRDAWPAVIQPKSKIVMAMVLDMCLFLPVRSLLIATIGPVCGKYISVLKETTKRSENDQNPDVILSRVGPELELKTEQRNNETPSSTLDKDIGVFKRVSLTLKAASWQATAGERTMPGSNDRERGTSRRQAVATAMSNEYFVPIDGIDREVITADICRYLGNEALVRPGDYENPQTRQIQKGYFITAYRNLTTAMIEDLKADSKRWQAERRATASRGQPSVGYQYSQSPFRAQFRTKNDQNLRRSKINY
ncbi:hypothetical protein BGZ57DRAFT_958311 [Hyaloscypha finlandica]|nr:hypothetical protein BGZ57DRAFT_958311 [Hyaloscypha finlandica]